MLQIGLDCEIVIVDSSNKQMTKKLFIISAKSISSLWITNLNHHYTELKRSFCSEWEVKTDELLHCYLSSQGEVRENIVFERRRRDCDSVCRKIRHFLVNGEGVSISVRP